VQGIERYELHSRWVWLLKWGETASTAA
jgi:hypothetical protein